MTTTRSEKEEKATALGNACLDADVRPARRAWSTFWSQPRRILSAYRPRYLRPDLMAGLTVAALAIPQAIAYAAIAELPPQTGLYTAVIAAVVASLWGSSRFLHSGPTNATSLLVLSVLLGVLSDPFSDLPRFMMAAGVVAVLAGLFRLALAYLHFGSLVTLASRPVLLGFTVGAGVLISLGQVRHLLGLEIPVTSHAATMLADLAGRIEQTHLPCLWMGLATLGLIVLLAKINRRIPAMLIAMSAAALAVWVLDLEPQGMAVVGDIPRSLPRFTFWSGLGSLDFALINKLALGSLAVAALGLIEAMASAQTLARQAGHRLDNNQEFFGQGLANVCCGLFSGFPASGSFTRSAANQQAGARTQMAGVFSGVAILLAMLLLAPYARYIPRAALAGVLFVVAYRMIDRKAIRRVLTTSRAESTIMVTTFGATLMLSLEFAVLSGVVLSLAYFVMQSSLPRVYQVVPDPTFRHFVYQPEAPVCPQLGVVNISGPLFFGAVAHVEEELSHNLERHPSQNHLVIRMHGVNLCDLTGVEMLEAVVRHHRQLGGDVYLIRLRRPVQEELHDSGFFETIGADHVLQPESAMGVLFDQAIDPMVCIYECEHKVFAECQAIEKHAYPNLPARPVCVDLDPARFLPVDQAREMMAAAQAVTVDVREEREFLRGHLPGARLLCLRHLLARQAELPRDQTLLLTCRSGRRSALAMRMLQELGFDNVYGLRGGYLAWLAAGLPHTADES